MQRLVLLNDFNLICIRDIKLDFIGFLSSKLIENISTPAVIFYHVNLNCTKYMLSFRYTLDSIVKNMKILEYGNYY